MTLFGTANGAQLAILTKILDDYCTEFGIAKGDEVRENLGRRIMALFNCGGYSMEQIEQFLRQVPEEAAKVG